MTAVHLLSAGLLVAMASGASVGAVPQAARPVAAPPTLPLPPMTRLEALLAQPDTVVSEDRYRLNDRQPIPGLLMDAVVVTELAPQAQVLRGLRVEVREGGSTGHVSVSYLDAEEATSLAAAVVRIWNLAEQWTGREDARSSTVQFTSLDGFAIGFRQDGRDQHAFVIAGFETPARLALTVPEFATIKAGIDQALQIFATR